MMETREFWGRDMGEVLQAVRASLGADALILETLNVPSKDDADGRGQVKVIAMQGQKEKPTTFRSAVETGNRMGSRDEGGARREGGSLTGRDTNGWEGRSIRDFKEIGRQLADVKSLLSWLIPGMKESGVLGELVAQDVPPDLLSRLIRATEKDGTVDEREQIRRALIRSIPVGGDVETKSERRTCLALIGPPGMGKTSVVVRLTVHLMENSDRRIGWVSLDNRRVTGAEELTVYAGILKVPCEVAESAEGLAHALEHLSTCDLVLIDTPGVSPRDATGLSDLAGVLQGQNVPEVRRTLVLSATTNGRDLVTWAQRYDRLGFDSFLFTMVDECNHFGPLLNTVMTNGKPLAYLASGQSVTKGLEVARPETVASLMLP